MIALQSFGRLASPTSLSLAPHAECFEACLRPQLSELRAYALRLSRNPSDADDLLQDTVLRAWRFWGRYRAGTNLRAWLHRILLNTFRNRYRKAQRERDVTLRHQAATAALEAQATEPTAWREDLSDEVQRTLSAIPPDFRAVLCAVAIDDLSYREAATRLGCPVGTVMSRLHRARRAFVSSLATTG